MTSQTWVQVLAGVLGLVMGSAVTALSHRVPRHVSWIHGRSACPRCGAQLRPRDLVPVLSWASSRGRCRHCGERISFRYPLTEILCGFLLIALMWIDLDFQLLPDVLTLPGTLIALGAVLPSPGGTRHALLGVLMGSGLLWLLATAYWKVRKVEGMGGGDIKLAAMFGVVLGWKLTLLALFLAALIGSLWGILLMVRKKGGGQTALPFGTLLAPAAMAAFLWGPAWLAAYTALFRRP